MLLLTWDSPCMLPSSWLTVHVLAVPAHLTLVASIHTQEQHAHTVANHNILDQTHKKMVPNKTPVQ